MLGWLGTLVTRDPGTWVSGYHVTLVTVTLVPGYPGNPGSWVTRDLRTWLPGYHVTLVLGWLGNP